MRRKLLVVRSPRRLDVFGDQVAEARILDRPLTHWQRHAAAEANLDAEFVDQVDGMSGAHFVMEGDLFVTPQALVEFVRRAEAGRGNARAGLASNPVLDRVVVTHGAEQVPGGHVFGLRYVADSAPGQRSVLLQQDDLPRLFMRLPKAVDPDGGTVLPHSAKTMLHLRSPLHLYLANMACNQAMTPSRVPAFRALRHVAAPVLAGNRVDQDKWNRIGPGCVVHPTAWVEGCELGRNVVIGAGAVCTGSVLGDGAQVLEGACVSGSVVGANAMVGQHYRVILSVIYPECFVTSGALQFSVIGSAAGVYAAWVTDVRMDRGTVSTTIDGQVVDTGMRFFGCVLGHGSRLTAGVITAPGRAIPNGTTVYPDPAQVLMRFPPDHPAGAPLFLGRRPG